MTILPIVERELRVAARRRGTYWTRFGVAVMAIMLGTVLMLASLNQSPLVQGGYIFSGLAILAMFYCLLAGRISTTDCLTEEKREGTLGLLFLTDLNGYDVVLGKLAATSLNSFYGLLALFPVLATPLLLGGVTNGQFWRVVLVLVNTFLFSLAVGMCCSACCSDVRKSLGLNMALMVLFSPISLYPLFASLSVRLGGATSTFWFFELMIHGLTWVFLFSAARIVPHSWQDASAPTGPSGPVPAETGRGWNHGAPANRAAFRKRLLDVNAFYWLTARPRLKPLQVWFIFGLLCFWWLGVRGASGGDPSDLASHFY